MRIKILTVFVLSCLSFFLSCKDSEVPTIEEPTSFEAENFASGLKSPIGMTLDDKGRIWVSEAGTGKDDASVSVVTSTGQVHQVITGFKSEFANGAIEGMGHLTFKDGKLYILNGLADRLYIADVSSYNSGDLAIAPSEIESEDVGTYIESLNLTDPLNSNAYNLTFGPNDDLFIIDAGSNAIIRRDKSTKALSLFAKIPNVTATAESVPTSIIYDGSKFLLSTFSGAPFVKGTAKIVQVDRDGHVSDFKTGFTTLSSLTLTPNNRVLATEFAEFSLTSSTPGFQPATGRVSNEDGSTLISGLSMPTDIERSGDRTYFVLNYSSGDIKRLTY